MAGSEGLDLIVLGAGPGGYTLALDAARRGLKTALVDDGEALGGTCLNVGCIPSKALLESSELFFRLRSEAASHGIRVPEGAAVDLKAMMARKAAVVEKLTGGLATLMTARKVQVIRGRGLVDSPGSVTVSVDGDAADLRLQAPRIVLATGSEPTPLPHLPFDGTRILDSTDALALTKAPRRLAVIGAGAVGLELGSVWSRLGSEVTVIEAMDRIVPGADAQASRSLAAALRKQGLSILTGSRVERAEVSSRKVELGVTSGKGEQTVAVDKVLVAVGRRARVDSGLGPGVQPSRSADGRFLAVNDRFETDVEGLYAIGDLVGNPMLAHKAEEEALVLSALLAGEAPPPWGGPIPGIVYTDPEMAWAGAREDELKAAGTEYVKGHFPFAANGRALASGGAEGFVKLLSSPGDRRLLGAVIVGSRASELIAEAVGVMAMGGSAEDIALTVHGHPTLSEAVREAALGLVGRPLNRA